MGIQGAAIATVSAQFITLVTFIIIYKKHNPNLKIFNLKNFNFQAMKEILSIGLPVGVQSMLFTVISIYIGRVVFSFGANVVSGQRIGVQIEQLTWMISGGFQSAITVFVGQNFGAKTYSRIKRSLFDISAILIPYALVITMLLLFIPETLLRIFIDDDQAVEAGVNYLKIISISQVFMIVEGIGTGFFNGIGKSFIPSIVGIIGNTSRIPLVIWLTDLYQEKGIWWSLNFSTVFKAFLIIIFFILFIRNLNEMRLNRLTFKKKVRV
jgi:Na+-driven multidrug efflux pump